MLETTAIMEYAAPTHTFNNHSSPRDCDYISKDISITLLYTLSILLVSLFLTKVERSTLTWLVVPLSLMVATLSTLKLYRLLPFSSVTSSTTFQCPHVPFVPLLGIGCNTFLMGSMPLQTWYSIFIWMSLGMAVYIFYGRRHSIIQDNSERSTPS